ncbi:MAG: porin, partial [Bacteroidetes bacterium]|nr:porin [Bacteroidota bacterium]
CESAITNINWTLTRSLCAENSPYFETGARLTYSMNSKWTFAALVLNGWQNIVDNNSNKAGGTQIVFVPSDKITINSSSFVGEGRNLPDGQVRLRYFHDLYAIFQLNDNLAATILLDNGFEEKFDSISEASWMTYMALLRYKPSENFAICFRFERFLDPAGVIVSTGTPGNYQVSGLSMNVDFSPAKNVLLRVEGKTFSSVDDIFPKGKDVLSDKNFLLTTSLAVGF